MTKLSDTQKLAIKLMQAGNKITFDGNACWLPTYSKGGRIRVGIPTIKALRNAGILDGLKLTTTGEEIQL